ncbi:hypothetical protein ACHAWF_003617, partial [Thalassiosira exigua]
WAPRQPACGRQFTLPSTKSTRYCTSTDVTSSFSFSRDSSTICLASGFATTKQPGLSSTPTQTTLASFVEILMGYLFQSSSSISILIENNRISTSTYQKPINLYQYIPPSSAHPPYMMRGIIFSLMRNYKRQTPSNATAKIWQLSSSTATSLEAGPPRQ